MSTWCGDLRYAVSESELEDLKKALRYGMKLTAKDLLEKRNLVPVISPDEVPFRCETIMKDGKQSWSIGYKMEFK